jgi:DNA repair exonuclease SbcCD ATPase subunit
VNTDEMRRLEGAGWLRPTEAARLREALDELLAEVERLREELNALRDADLIGHLQDANDAVAEQRYGQGEPPAGGWKLTMAEDPTEYAPEFQDEYRRLWHEARAEVVRLRAIPTPEHTQRLITKVLELEAEVERLREERNQARLAFSHAKAGEQQAQAERDEAREERERLCEDLIDIRNYTRQPWTMPERLQAISDTVTRAQAAGMIE